MTRLQVLLYSYAPMLPPLGVSLASKRGRCAPASGSVPASCAHNDLVDGLRRQCARGAGAGAGVGVAGGDHARTPPPPARGACARLRMLHAHALSPTHDEQQLDKEADEAHDDEAQRGPGADLEVLCAAWQRCVPCHAPC